MYRKALKLDPHSALIYKNLGTNLLAQHKYKKAGRLIRPRWPSIRHLREQSSPRVRKPRLRQERGAMNYYMAKGCVRAGQNDRAIEYLRMALNEGFTNAKKIAADDGFALLRGNPAFQKLLADQKQQKQQSGTRLSHPVLNSWGTVRSPQRNQPESHR